MSGVFTADILSHYHPVSDVETGKRFLLITSTSANEDDPRYSSFTGYQEFAVEQHRVKALNTTTQENTAAKQIDEEKVFPNTEYLKPCSEVTCY